MAEAGLGGAESRLPRQAVLRLSDRVDWRREVDGRSVLGWQMRELQRWGIEAFVLASARLPELGRLAAGLPKPAAISVAASEAEALAGVAPDEPVMLVRGEGVAAGDFGPAFAAFARDGTARGCRRVMFAADAGEACDGGIVLAGRAQALSEPRAATVVAGRVIDVVAEGVAALRRPALLLDRDGVLNQDFGYVGTWERWEWVSGAVAAVRQATARGWHVFVVTNQSGVARGLFGEAAVAALHRRMAAALRAGGGTVDDIRVCPFHPQGTVERYRRESDWRKPAPGMVLDLMRAWELDAARCVLVGDQERDLAAAAAAGVTGHLFRGGDLAEFVRHRKARGFAPGPH